MNEFATISRARRFLKEAGIKSVPVDLKRLTAAANARIKLVRDMRDDESGQTTRLGGKHVIIVNGNHRAERQRFTVLHELGHIVLDLPSQHGGPTLKTETLLGYRGRPEEEMLCDVFAAECLLPYETFGKEVADSDISMETVKSFARAYEASLTATGSRFALNANAPCAFVLSEAGRVRYVSRSKYLNELKGWIGFNTPVPRDSVAGRLMRDGMKNEDYDEIPADVWFDGGIRNRPVVEEESMVLHEWNQCLSLLWFDESVSPLGERGDTGSDEDELLKELDGVLPWPSKSRRR
ncbi:MAG: ImmA/IrrE family metallo-endopeptidase [Gammaproteobacteria bacterium]|nr:ImmA/IrrE family metallo-endopeptidase [Gammaproteobacteria bacterium]